MTEQFIWLRPWWLLCLLPLALLLYLMVRRRSGAGNWETVIDPALLPYVLEPVNSLSRRWPFFLLGFGWLVVTLVLAGPSWERQALPVFQGQDAQVIVLDLSRSMDADDVKPTRLTRARFKVSDLFRRAAGMQVGLVVFSEVPYVISPLTDDMATIEAFLPALTTSVLPVQGGRIEPALERAQQLLLQAGVGHGMVTLITDSVANNAAIDAAADLVSNGYSLSVIGVGTAQGVPVKREGGSFIEDANGKIVLPKLDRVSLRSLAAAGEGVYVDLDPGDADLVALDSVLRLSGEIELDEEQTRESENWTEYAPWLLPLVLLSGLGLFRRGAL